MSNKTLKIQHQVMYMKMRKHHNKELDSPCLLHATRTVGAFLEITVSVNNTYRNSATSLTSFWKTALSTTNTIALEGIMKCDQDIISYHMRYSDRLPCTHLAADLNFSRY